MIHVLKAEPGDQLYVLWDDASRMPAAWSVPELLPQAEVARADLLGSSLAEAPTWHTCVALGWNGRDLHGGLLPHRLLLDFALLFLCGQVDHAAGLVDRYGALVPRR